MSNPNDGGPAFPVTRSTDFLGNSTARIETVGGMSLRDWFAGQALANHVICDASNYRNNASYAYESADAMLKEREVKP